MEDGQGVPVRADGLKSPEGRQERTFLQKEEIFLQNFDIDKICQCRVI